MAEAVFGVVLLPTLWPAWGRGRGRGRRRGGKERKKNLGGGWGEGRDPPIFVAFSRLLLPQLRLLRGYFRLCVCYPGLW